jgi:hypothetical protein
MDPVSQLDNMEGQICICAIVARRLELCDLVHSFRLDDTDCSNRVVLDMFSFKNVNPPASRGCGNEHQTRHLPADTRLALRV